MKDLEAQVPANLGAETGELLSDGLNVLVTTTTKVENNVLVLVHGLGQLHGTPDGVGRLKSGDDTLSLGESTEALHGLGVVGGDEKSTVGVLPGAQLGADTGVVKTGRDRVGLGNLAVLVLKNVGSDTVEDTVRAAGESGGVAASVNTVTTSLNTNQLDAGVLREGVEHTDSVAATTNTGNDGIGELANGLVKLLLGLVTNDGLEGANNQGEGMGTNGGTNDIVSGVKVGDPRAESLVDGVTEGTATSVDSDNLSAQKLHAENVESLAANILGTHEDSALHVELSTDSSSSDTVLASTGLSNDAGLAQTLGDQDLTDGVVDLVATGVVKILALQPDLSTANVLSKVLSKVEAAGTAHVRVVGAELLPEAGVDESVAESLLELGKTVHQGLGNVLATKLTEARSQGGGVLGAVKSHNLVTQTGTGSSGLSDDLGGLSLSTRQGLGLVDSLNELLLVGDVSVGVTDKLAASNAGQVVLSGLGGLARLGLSNVGDELTADDNTLGKVLDVEEVLTSADTESEGSRNVAGPLMDTAQKLGQVRTQLASGTGNTHARDNVDERISNGAKKLHALLLGRGGNEGNIRKPARS